MKNLIVLLVSIFSISANATEVTVRHRTCQAILSVGADGRYIMNSTYKIDFDGYAKLVTKALELKGYKVVKTLNYGDVSFFGKEGMQRSKDNNLLAIEFRVTAPSYDDEGTEKHRCAGGFKLTDPKNELKHSISDSNGAHVGEFTTYQPLYERELESEISRWIPLRSQCQGVFNALVSTLPACNIEK